MTPNLKNPLHMPFCITLVGFSAEQVNDFKKAFRGISDPLPFSTRSVNAVSGASYPEVVVHAIVLAPKEAHRLSKEDLDAIRLSTGVGTCRVYDLSDTGESVEVFLDEYIQRTQEREFAAVAKEIFAFFHEVDRLNKESTPRAIRDKACLKAYRILNHLWPVSYTAAVLLLLFTISAFVGKTEWGDRYLPSWAMAIMIFYASFFVVHCIRTIIRNWGLAVRVAERVDLKLVIGSVMFGSAGVATSYSIVLVSSLEGLGASLLLAALLLAFYLYTRRIRFECTSISNLQESLADSNRSEAILNDISKTHFSHDSFSLFPSRDKKLFISYMHKTPSQWSSISAEKVHKWAEKEGFEVFLDRSAIQSGALWRQSLLRAVSECDVFVALLDGDVPATPWVLAESAYASLLRKSIGKPRTLLVIKNPDPISRDKTNPFHRIYADVFECTPGKCFGATVLPVDEGRPLTEVRFLQAMSSMRPMSLLSGGHGNTTSSAKGAGSEMKGVSSVQVDDFQLADRAWRLSVLLISLAQTGDKHDRQIKLLESKCRKWIGLDSAMRKSVALNALRFLVKGGLVVSNGDLHKDVLEIFLTETSLAVRLAASDFLGATGCSENPLLRLTEHERRQIAGFSSRFISKMQSSQKAYANTGVHADVRRIIKGKSAEVALQEEMQNVERLPI